MTSSERREEALQRTKDSIQDSMKAAEEKGSLTKVEAMQLMMKMLMLKRMEGAAGPDDGANNAQQQREDDAQLPTQAGCTAVVCMLRGSELFVANAGDSRAVLCRAGEALALSVDHKPALESEINRIKAAGGFITDQGRVNGNLNLTRSIGDLRYKLDESLPPKAQIITAEPDIFRYDLDRAKDEFVIVACDGIWDCMTNQEAVDFVRPRVQAGVALDTIVEQLFDRIIAADPKETQGIGGDNMTCIILQLEFDGAGKK